jgi:hypothetical protein
MAETARQSFVRAFFIGEGDASSIAGNKIDHHYADSVQQQEVNKAALAY